jgi:hypothetical protein
VDLFQGKSLLTSLYQREGNKIPMDLEHYKVYNEALRAYPNALSCRSFGSRNLLSITTGDPCLRGDD